MLPKRNEDAALVVLIESTIILWIKRILLGVKCACDNDAKTIAPSFWGLGVDVRARHMMSDAPTFFLVNRTPFVGSV
jgi:hypothetical protein